jgi:ABC-type multidrug transport system ATPase subunit
MRPVRPSTRSAFSGLLARLVGRQVDGGPRARHRLDHRVPASAPASAAASLPARLVPVREPSGPAPATAPSTTPVSRAAVVARRADEAGKGLVCTDLTVRYRGRSEPTIREVSLDLPPGRLLCVVGPSGSGKSTLCATILGEIDRIEGEVLLDGVDLLRAPSVARQWVSFVPQRDAVHDELTPMQALTLTARLRLSSRLSPQEQAHRVTEVLRTLEIADHANTRIGHLSGGQRKRVAVAMELLSEPRLLMLDEPTAGLDEGLDRSMMMLLRRIANSGCAVMVITHSNANLGLADSVLAFDSQGQVAYEGSPAGILEEFDVPGLAEAMQALRVTSGEASAPPATRGRWFTRPARRNRRPAAGRRGQGRPQVVRAAAPRASTAEPGVRSATGTRRPGAGRRAGQVRPRRTDGASAVDPVPGSADLGFLHSTRVLISREFKRMAGTPLTAARGILLLPLLTVMFTAWASTEGLAGWAYDPNRMQGAVLQVLLNCTTFFAMALSFVTIVGDRPVIAREHRWGVPPMAVVLSKGIALTGPVILQSVIAVSLYLMVRQGPDHVLPGKPVWATLLILLAVTGIAAMTLGLSISATSASLDRVVFMLMGVTATLLVVTGVMIPLGHPSGAGAHILSILGQFTPTRWGTAAVSAYIGFVPLDVLDSGGTTTNDSLWTHDTHHVATALVALALMSIMYVLAAAFLLSRQLRRRR